MKRLRPPSTRPVYATTAPPQPEAQATKLVACPTCQVPVAVAHESWTTDALGSQYEQQVGVCGHLLTSILHVAGARFLR